MYNLVVLIQIAPPEVHNRLRGRLGSRYTYLVIEQRLVKVMLVHADIFQIRDFIDKKGHGNHFNPKLFPLGLGYTAIAVCHNLYFAHSNLHSEAPASFKHYLIVVPVCQSGYILPESVSVSLTPAYITAGQILPLKQQKSD